MKLCCSIGFRTQRMLGLEHIQIFIIMAMSPFAAFRPNISATRRAAKPRKEKTKKKRSPKEIRGRNNGIYSFGCRQRQLAIFSQISTNMLGGGTQTDGVVSTIRVRKQCERDEFLILYIHISCAPWCDAMIMRNIIVFCIFSSPQRDARTAHTIQNIVGKCACSKHA